MKDAQHHRQEKHLEEQDEDVGGGEGQQQHGQQRRDGAVQHRHAGLAERLSCAQKVAAAGLVQEGVRDVRRVVDAEPDR